MKIMPCPLNGPRNISEFVCAGEFEIEPDPATASDPDWADHLFMLDNQAGIVREWWYHVPTSYWFIAERNTVTDENRSHLPSGRTNRTRGTPHEFRVETMSGGVSRLPAPWGACIDRDTPVRFSFEGREIEGFAGDTIASALAANGIRLLSRSFKYHRPRGSMSMSGDDGGALVQVGDEPNVLADVRQIEPGMTVVGQNYIGSLESDQASILERFKPFLPVGFYYKAFFRPRGIWNYWEKVIRQTAGLGRVNLHAPKRYYDKVYEFCDVVVIGAGPAGLAAAAEAAESGADVLLVEREPDLGGSLAFSTLRPRRIRSGADSKPTSRMRRGPVEPAGDDECRVHRLVCRQLAVDHQRKQVAQASRPVGRGLHRDSGATAAFSRERPAGHHVRGCGPEADKELRGQARTAGGRVHLERRGLWGGARSGR